MSGDNWTVDQASENDNICEKTGDVFTSSSLITVQIWHALPTWWKSDNPRRYVRCIRIRVSRKTSYKISNVVREWVRWPSRLTRCNVIERPVALAQCQTLPGSTSSGAWRDLHAVPSTYLYPLGIFRPLPRSRKPLSSTLAWLITLLKALLI